LPASNRSRDRFVDANEVHQARRASRITIAPATARLGCRVGTATQLGSARAARQWLCL